MVWKSNPGQHSMPFELLVFLCWYCDPYWIAFTYRLNRSIFNWMCDRGHWAHMERDQRGADSFNIWKADWG